MDSHELENNTKYVGENDDKVPAPTRWRQIDLGLMPKLFKAIFVNISDKSAGILTILTTTAMSLSDIISDIVIAVTLFSMEEYAIGLFVLLVDFFPSWTLVAHNLFSDKWRPIVITKDKFATVFLVFSITLF